MASFHDLPEPAHLKAPTDHQDPTRDKVPFQPPMFTRHRSKQDPEKR
jgi:hypothetical protein